MGMSEYLGEELFRRGDGRVFELKLNLAFRFFCANLDRCVFGCDLVDCIENCGEGF